MQRDNESATRAFAQELFPTPTARQQVAIARALTLAAALDVEADGAKMAALSREHRQVMTDLAQQVHQLIDGRAVDALPQPGDADSPDVPAAQTASVVIPEDRVAAHRASIARKRAGG